MRRLCGYLAFLALTLSGVGVVTLVRIRRAARTQRLEPADAIIVFGAAIWGAGPSATLRLRTMRGVELYERGLAPVVVCSGGMSGGVSEPRLMADLMVAHGVPASALVLDEAGVTTRATIASLRKLSGGNWRRILAVSSPFHLFRIVEESRRHGIEALPCPTRRPPTHGLRAKLRLLLWDARQYARETVAVWAQSPYFRDGACAARAGADNRGAMNDLTLGRLRVSAVVERAGPTRPTWLLPDATPEALERHREWLAPHFLDDRGRLLQSIHTFVVRAPGLTALVDTCVGNDKDRGGQAPFHMMRTNFLEDLRAAGVPPESVDLVICTHLHVDHVGWNTRLDNGRWVPTFPRARHLFARTEWEHWSSERAPSTRRIMADSVQPVLDAGLATLVEMDHRVSDELWLEPTPGHTPGHVSVRLSSEDGEAVITGDIMHHPVQVAEPGWGSHFDSDVEQARKTRRAFCERYADGPIAVLGTHFNHPTAGRILRHGDAWRFVVPA